MNPCPCGYLGDKRHACRCTPDQIARYRDRISGPLLDRIDMRIDVPALAEADLLGAPEGEPSARIAARVAAARERALRRQGQPNDRLDTAQIDTHCAANAEVRQLLRAASARLGWSARAFHRVLKLARTIADLADADTLAPAHVAEAIQYRRELRANPGVIP
jgi:magnesium chelatase family protein